MLCHEPPRTQAVIPVFRWSNGLSVYSGIRLKLCILMLDVIYHGTAPSYITELCRRCHNTRLHSTARRDFVAPTTRLRFADKSFSSWIKSLEFTATECSKRWIKAHFQAAPTEFPFYSVFWVDSLDTLRLVMLSILFAIVTIVCILYFN